VIGFFTWQAFQPAKPLYFEGLVSPSSDAVLNKDAADSMEPFSKIVTEDNQQYVDFEFPANEFSTTSDESGGGYGYLSSSQSNIRAMAGTVRFQRGPNLYVNPSSRALKIKHFFERFRPGEITGIFLLPNEAEDDLFIAATKIPGISQIFCEECNSLTAAIVPALTYLKIEIFMAGGLAVDGRPLSLVHFLPDTKVLDLNQCAHLTPVLKVLGGSEKLEMLNVSRADLGDADYDLISNIPSLYCLNLAGDSLTADNLQALSRLPNLHTLDLIRAKFTGVNLGQELKRFPRLTTLVLAADDITAADKQALKRECPHLVVREEDPALLRYVPAQHRERAHRSFVDGPRRHVDAKNRNHFMYCLVQTWQPGDSDLQGPTMKELEKQFLGSRPVHSQTAQDKRPAQQDADDKHDKAGMNDRVTKDSKDAVGTEKVDEHKDQPL
jgi:hypothetical protein